MRKRRWVGGRARASLLLLLFSMGFGWLPAQDRPVGQQGDVWNLGKLQAGRTYKTTVTAKNINCKGKHNFEIRPDFGEFGFLRIEGDPIVRGLAPGQSGTLPAVVDLTLVGPGEYNTGRLITRCLDCPPNCKMDYTVLSVLLTVVAKEEKGGAPPAGGPGTGTRTGPGTGTATGGSPSPPPASGSPDDDEKKVSLCGPDVSDAMADALFRVAARYKSVPRAAQDGNGGMPGFLKLNLPLPLVPDVSLSCPSPNPACTGTVWLWGQCVAAIVPQWILEGFTGSLFEMKEARKTNPEKDGGTKTNSGHNVAFSIGGSVRKYFNPPEFPTMWDEPGMRAPADQMKAYLRAYPPGDAFKAARLCGKCGSATVGFTEDSTLQTWKLPNGTDLPPPK